MQREEQMYRSESADSAGAVYGWSRGPSTFISLDSLTNSTIPVIHFSFV